MIILNNENIKKYENFFLTEKPLSAYCFFAEDSSLYVRVNSSEENATDQNSLNLKSPIPLVLNELVEPLKRPDIFCLLFSYTPELYSLETIIPTFMEYFGRLYIIEDPPKVNIVNGVGYLDFSSNFLSIAEVGSPNILFPVYSRKENLNIMCCCLSKCLRELCISKFKKLNFSEEEFDNRAENAVKSLSKEFTI